MGVFKKLKGNDVRVTPIQTKYGDGALKGTVIAAVNRNPDGPGEKADRTEFFAAGAVGTANIALLYNSIRQLFYGSFVLTKIIFHPISSITLFFRVFTKNFQTKMEMSIFKKIKLIKLNYSAPKI